MPIRAIDMEVPAGPAPRGGDAAEASARIRSGRKLLNWSPERLARHARVTVGVVLQAEREEGHALLAPAAARALQQVLEGAGVAWDAAGAAHLR